MRWKTGLGMSSARAATASASPPASSTTWAATREGKIRLSTSSKAKFSTSPAIAAISRIWIARLARTVGMRGAAFSGLCARLCRIRARSEAPARKNMSWISAASFGCIAMLVAMRCSASVGTRDGPDGGVEISRANGTLRPSWVATSPSFCRTGTGVCA